MSYATTSDEFLSFVLRAGADAAEAARLLDANPELVQAKTDKNVTPLMLAVMEDHLDIAALLLDRGADINATDFEGSTALHWAVGDRNEKAARLLLERGADWTLKDSAGLMPYDKARQYGCEGIVSALDAKMAAGPPPSRKAAPPKKAIDIFAAAARGKGGELRQIVYDYPDSPRWREPVTDATALRNVIVYLPPGNSPVPAVEDAVFLLEHGADVNARDRGGRTLLMEAVNSQKPSPFTDVLLAFGADLQLMDADGATATDIARRCHNPDLGKILRCQLERSVAGTEAPIRLRKPLVLKR